MLPLFSACFDDPPHVAPPANGSAYASPDGGAGRSALGLAEAAPIEVLPLAGFPFEADTSAPFPAPERRDGPSHAELVESGDRSARPWPTFVAASDFTERVGDEVTFVGVTASGYLDPRPVLHLEIGSGNDAASALTLPSLMHPDAPLGVVFLLPDSHRHMRFVDVQGGTFLACGLDRCSLFARLPPGDGSSVETLVPMPQGDIPDGVGWFLSPGRAVVRRADGSQLTYYDGSWFTLEGDEVSATPPSEERLGLPPPTTSTLPQVHCPEAPGPLVPIHDSGTFAAGDGRVWHYEPASEAPHSGPSKIQDIEATTCRIVAEVPPGPPVDCSFSVAFTIIHSARGGDVQEHYGRVVTPTAVYGRLQYETH